MKSWLPHPASIELEPESEAGPLWITIKRQLYRSEVSHVKRLVGEALIKDNQMMFDELESLQHMLSDFQRQNDMIIADSPQVAPQLTLASRAPSLHRELLRQQAQMLLQDAQSQADACGWTLEELIPALGDHQLQDFVTGMGARRGPQCHKSDLLSGSRTPSTRPSTRPSSASGVSGCSMPEHLASMPVLPLGRTLAVEELSSVAESIREALEEEQSTLMAAISEQLTRLDTEDVRFSALAQHTTTSMKHDALGEPSTAELQRLVGALQDFIITHSPSSSSDISAGPPPQSQIVGGSQVRRLKALIAQRRNPTQAAAALPDALDKVPEVMGTLNSSGISAEAGSPFDLFFGDPFAN